MRIGVVGAGRIGGNLARLLTQAGHDVVISYARDAGELRARAAGSAAAQDRWQKRRASVTWSCCPSPGEYRRGPG